MCEATLMRVGAEKEELSVLCCNCSCRIEAHRPAREKQGGLHINHSPTFMLLSR